MAGGACSEHTRRESARASTMFVYPACVDVPERQTGMRGTYAFFREFLRHPAEVASLIPSSATLRAIISREASLADARHVVELGPGSGGTTRTVLAGMRPDARLLAIEINPRLHRLLADIHDHRLVAHHGSATDLAAILETHGFGAPDAVISGIPFSRLPRGDGQRVVESVAHALAPGGRFVAYQVSDRVAQLTRPVLGEGRRTRVWRNVPPIRVYRWARDDPDADRPSPAR